MASRSAKGGAGAGCERPMRTPNSFDIVMEHAGVAA
jgi:hypothetical protein